MVATTYKKFGRIVTAGDGLPKILIPIAEAYFNQCVYDIQSRHDSYINEAFDNMTAIKLQNKNHPMDVLHIIVMLSLDCINSMQISDIITDNYHTSMEAVRHHLRAIIARHRSLAVELTGCDKTHLHTPIETTKVFTFAIDTYVQTDKGPVKLSTL